VSKIKEIVLTYQRIREVAEEINILYGSGKKLSSEFFQLIKEIFNTRKLPLDFTKYEIIPIPKKATANKCDQHPTISLLTHI